MSTIITAVCAVIPDPLETWLAGGGNMTLAVLALLGLGLYSLAHAGAGEARG
ncbi:hypothetical protein [Kocuria rhizophila]|uniref:hypothetical protein n=1 Tax=Kocuria rhizophila TaxID=72000 RepID=UPI0002F3B911|nr:hypothetical protein [Kocuria rhizophila]